LISKVIKLADKCPQTEAMIRCIVDPFGSHRLHQLNDIEATYFELENKRPALRQ